MPILAPSRAQRGKLAESVPAGRDPLALAVIEMGGGQTETAVRPVRERISYPLRSASDFSWPSAIVR